MWGREVILKGKKTLDIKKCHRAGKNGESSQGCSDVHFFTHRKIKDRSLKEDG